MLKQTLYAALLIPLYAAHAQIGPTAQLCAVGQCFGTGVPVGRVGFNANFTYTDLASGLQYQSYNGNWTQAKSSGNSAGLTSFNGRTAAAAVPQSGDYTAAQVGALPTDSPTITTKYTLADPSAGNNPFTTSITTPQTGVSRYSVVCNNTGNQCQLIVMGGGYSAIGAGVVGGGITTLSYNNNYAFWKVDSQNIASCPNNGAACTFFVPLIVPQITTPLPEVNESTPIAAAATIAPTSVLFHITGTTTISTMTPPAGMTASVSAGGVGGSLSFITDAAVTFSAGTGVGQFKSGFTSTAGTAYTCLYTPSTGLYYCK